MVIEGEVDVFWNSLAFYDPMSVGSLFSGSSAFSKSSLHIWKFTYESRAGLGSQACLRSLLQLSPFLPHTWISVSCVVVLMR